MRARKRIRILQFTSSVYARVDESSWHECLAFIIEDFWRNIVLAGALYQCDSVFCFFFIDDLREQKGVFSSEICQVCVRLGI